MQENVKQVTVKMTARRAFRTEPIWQYDVGHELVFDGFELPGAFEVHFSLSPTGKSITQIGQNGVCVLPDMFTQTAAPIYAWLYIADTETGLTKYSIEIPVQRRAKPTDQQPTPVQQSAIDQAITALNAGAEAAEDAQEAAEAAQEAAETAQGQAEDAATRAANSATDANASREFADQSATAAQVAQGKAETAQTKAETAQGKAEDAQAAAEAAVGSYDAMTATATGLAAGASPTAEIDHTGAAPVLRLGIPKGDKGDPGDPGDPTELIDDTAGEGDVTKVWSADKSETELNSVKSAFNELEPKVDSLEINKADVIISSASGAIASFPDGADGMPVKELTVAVEPVQDLHGYDAPWPGGSGKNLFNTNRTELVESGGGTQATTRSFNENQIWLGLSYNNYFNRNRIVNYSNVDGVVTVEVTSTAYGIGFPFKCNGGVKYSVSSGGGNNASLAFGYYDADGVWLGNTGRAETSTITTPADCAWIVAVLCPNAESSVAYNNLQLEIGNVTAFVPYSNICPISGWTGANVTRTGINVWDEEWEIGGIAGVTGQPYGANDRIRSKNFCNCLTGTTYYGHIGKAGAALIIWWYDANKDFISGEDITNKSKTAPNNAAYFKISTYGGDYTAYLNDISINYPSTDTTYHPGHVQTIPVTFPSEAGTVYGAELTVNEDGTGRLVVDRKNVDMGSFIYALWNASSTRDAFSVTINDIKTSTSLNVPINAISSVFTPVSYNATWKPWQFSYTNNATQVAFMTPHSMFADATAFNQYVTGVQLVYELEEPVIYTLTALEVLETLKGVNNIWADTGDVSITYRADTKLYIDNKVTQAIAAALNA